MGFREFEAIGDLGPESLALLREWPARKEGVRSDRYTYTVRGREIRVSLKSVSLAGTKVPKVQLPLRTTWAGILRYLFLENVPGAFPYTAGVFPLKRTQELPTRMFAGEGGPERTNERFHLLSDGQHANRLSTAFDSVTLYGEDPGERPDIWGKVGEAGVSICTVEDVERLYAGFDLCAPTTSVSMTINGPAPMLLAMFMNTGMKYLARSYSVTWAGTDSVNFFHRFRQPPPPGSRPTPISTSPM